MEKQIRPALGAIHLDQLDTHTIDNLYRNLSPKGLSPRA